MMKKSEKRRGAFTLVEMMITMAILAVIFIPLVKIMMSATKTWWFARAKMTIEQDGRDALSFINKEFQGAYRFSMGNLIYNAGFEGYYNDILDRDQPMLWPAADYGDVMYNRSASSAVVASGYASVTLNAAGSQYAYIGPGGEGFEIIGDAAGTEVMFAFKAKASTNAVVATDVTGSVELFGVPLSPAFDVASGVGISSTTWTEFVSTYTLAPSANYNVVFKTTNGGVIIDEVSVRPIKSVLLDLVAPLTVNVTSYIYVSQTSGGAPGEPESMFRIDNRNTKSGDVIKRLNCYSVEYVAGSPDAGITTRFYNALAENLRQLEFRIELPSEGTNSPITIRLQMGAKVRGDKYGDPTTFTIRKTVYPRK
ncbi:MAG: prepilin-type N-terminal cleavage/methylation domain-containing protein [Candidatus Omnitrophica bacterium]|nr:prepilin-type N-terminal cleavage/methylation domain-containing protein [Candidatus Omnitrophota bacterium]MBU3929793.1 prepilin-type N-terminal cleavage/methylation domain-containing protein [bacterium]